MTRLRIVLALLVVIVPVAGFGTLAWADRQGGERIADGVRVEGIDVGGLSERQAIERIYAQLRERSEQPVRVRVAGERFRLTPKGARVRLGLHEAVRRAYEAGRGGNVVQRGWRALTGARLEHDEQAPVKVDRERVEAFVERIADEVAREPVNAQLEMNVEQVTVSEARAGRRLADRERLADRVESALLDPRGKRRLRARVQVVDPDVRKADVWERTPVVVTVSRSGRAARVFRRGELVRSYRVAVGEPKYPTPTGQFAVQTKQVDPPWHVPQSDWTGELAGRVIPGGAPDNPLKARWIGFNGSVGFHGTDSVGSLGTAASHGCVRMAVPDVIDLYDRVEVGTPVIVGG